MEKRERFWEIDAARGAAIICMLAVHAVYDLILLGKMGGELGAGFWGSLAFTTAITFVTVSGISFSISYSRHSAKRNFLESYPKFLKRGLLIFSGGLLITAATFFIVPKGFIIFGILHLIGASIMLAPLFFCFGEINILLGALVILAGAVAPAVDGPFWTIPVGFHPHDFYSLDYEPLLPWFGFFLFGMSMGASFYPNGRRIYEFGDEPGYAGKILSFLGRNSLLIYLIHQPMLLFAAYFIL